MFTYDQAPAILVRTMIYIQLSCSYPLVNHFQRVILFNLIWKTPNVSDYQFRMMNICISTVPLCFALFYPKIGSILGYAASVSGFLIYYYSFKKENNKCQTLIPSGARTIHIQKIYLRNCLNLLNHQPKEATEVAWKEEEDQSTH